LNGTACGVQYMLLEIHFFEYLQRHAFMHITGKILYTKDGVKSNSVQVDHFTET
jgi:hypothetical protein